MTATLRQQADMVALVGSESKAHVENLRRNPKRQAEADLHETRLPVLRDAFTTINELAKAEKP